jgi:predicted Zn-dependent protease
MKFSHIKIIQGILLICLFLLAGCAQPEAKIHNTADQGIDVYLIPMDDFNFEFTAQIAKSLSQEMNLRIKPTVQMGAAGLSAFPGTTQYSGEEILDLAKKAVPNFPENRTNTAYIVLTQRDINMNIRALRFNFTVHQNLNRIAVVSSARLVIGKDGGLADEKTIRDRITKMVKRSIGDVYYGYQRSTDIHDLMYSPIMSLDDVDRMGNDFLNTKNSR